MFHLDFELNETGERSGAVESKAAGRGMRSAVRGWAGGTVRGVCAGGGGRGGRRSSVRAELLQELRGETGDVRTLLTTELIQSIWTGRWEKG